MDRMGITLISLPNMQYYRTTTMKPGKAKANFNHTANDVWGAAVAAQRINGQYVKAIAPGTTQKTNRQIVEDLLRDPTQLTIDDLQQGVRVRQYFKGLTFKVIEGKALSDFSKSAMEIATKDDIASTYDLAVICSLPASYEKSSKRDDVDRRINFARGGRVGELSEKVTLNIEVLKLLWSSKFNVWYLTGITSEDQVVFFATRDVYDMGTMLTVQGVVKSHRDNSTQLGRAKVL